MKKARIALPNSVRRIFPHVTKVRDSNKAAIVDVLASDAKTGRKRQASGCAMAKAVCRELKADGAIIGLSYSYVIHGDEAVRYTTPVTVAREITSFDRHEDFEAGEYRLSPISKSQRLGTKPSGKKKKGSSHSATRVVHKNARVRNMKHKGGSDD